MAPRKSAHMVLSALFFLRKSGRHVDYSAATKITVKPSAKKSTFFRLIFLEGSFEVDSAWFTRRRICSEFSENSKTHIKKMHSNPLRLR